MLDTILMLYFLTAYTLGLAAILRSRHAAMRSPGRGAKYLMPTGILMMAIVGIAMLANFSVLSGVGAFRVTAPYGMIFCAIALSFLMIRAYSDAFDSRTMRLLGAVNDWACGAMLLGLAVSMVVGASGPMEIISLSYKNGALLAAGIVSFMRRKEPVSARPTRFLRAVGMISLPIVPVLVFAEIPPLRGLIIGYEPGVGFIGPCLLPAILIAWSVGILLYLKRDLPGDAALDSSVYASLSARETEVAGLLLEGKPYKQIADILSISIPTVKSHVSSIYRKTGTANRLELAAKSGIMPNHTKE